MMTIPDVRHEFYAEASRFPETEEVYEEQKVLFRNWRRVPRFKPYWSVLDALLQRTFD